MLRRIVLLVVGLLIAPQYRVTLFGSLEKIVCRGGLQKIVDSWVLFLSSLSIGDFLTSP
jgi:hypothetical protein